MPGFVNDGNINSNLFIKLCNDRHILKIVNRYTISNPNYIQLNTVEPVGN